MPMTWWKLFEAFAEAKKFVSFFLSVSEILVNLQHTACDRCMNLWNWYHLENVKSNTSRNYTALDKVLYLSDDIQNL